jgi:Flp pilus assembly protein TadD
MSEKRLEALRQMVLARPGDPRPHFGLAVELLRLGRTREGADALRRYLALGSDEGNGWGRLGIALAELGEVEEARRAFEAGIEIASRRGHPGLVEELREGLRDLP